MVTRDRKGRPLRALAFVASLALLTGGLVVLDGARAMPAHAAGPLTGNPPPAAAFPMYSGSTLLASSSNDEGYKGSDPQLLYAYTKAGEDLQALFHRTSRITTSTSPNYDTGITVTSPTGVVSTQVIPGNAAAGTQWGFLPGDLPSQEGIWTIEIKAASTAVLSLVALRSYSAVFDGATEKPGRMWSESLALRQSSTTGLINVWFMSSLGYIYKADYRNYWGLNSYISADAVGTVDVVGGVPDCSTSLYRSVPFFSTTQSAALGECGGAFRVFWQEPFSGDLPGSIPALTANDGASPSAWVNRQVQPPVFNLVNFVGDDDTIASGDLIADVDNFFGGVNIDVYDDANVKIRSFTVNVPEGVLPRQVPLHFDGLDDGGNPIDRDEISTFTVSGLNAGEIHFVLGDVEGLGRGMTIEVLNGTTAGTPEATRIYWADSDAFDGEAAYCNAPAAGVDTFNDGYLSGPYPNGFGTRCWGVNVNWGDVKFVDTWARQGVASTSSITLHDPQATYTLEKSADRARALPGDTVQYTVEIENTSAYDLWDLFDVVDDLSDVLDDATYNSDVAVAGDWAGLPDVGESVFDAAAQTLTFRGNVPAGGTATITYSVTVKSPATARGDSVLDNVVAGPATLPPEPCAIAGCRATSTPVKELTVYKAVDGTPTQNADGSWSLSYLITIGNDGGGTEPYTLDDDLRFGTGITVTSADAAAANGSTPTPSAAWNGDTTQTVITSTIPAGARHVYRIDVVADVGAGVIGTAAGTCPATGAGTGGFSNVVSLAASSAPATAPTAFACATPSRPGVQKTLTSLVQNADGSWTAVYRVRVTNASANALHYDLDDELRFSPGVTVSSPTVTGSPTGVTVTPGWNGDTQTAVAVGAALPPATPAGATIHEYTFEVTMALPAAPDLTSPAWTCPVAPSTAQVAFNNAASLLSGADSLMASACGVPVNPSVVKFISSQPVQQPDGSWTLSYDIVVTNSSDTPPGGLTYSLDDTLGYPTGVTVNSLTVTGPVGVTVDPGFTGGLTSIGGSAVPASTNIIAGGSQMIPAAAPGVPTTHAYRVTVNASVPAGLGAAELDCATGGGFRNNVLMTAADSGGIQVPATDCADITAAPGVSVAKTVVSATPADDGSWVIVYGLDVTNDDPLLVANYGLSDELDYAAVLPVNSAVVSLSPVGVALAAPAWNGGSRTLIAGNVPIPAVTTQRFEVTVVAIPDASVFGTAAADCPTGGFANSATVRTGIASPGNSDACAPITSPELEIAKATSAGAGVRLGGTVTYTVTATNVGAGPFTTVNPAWVIDDMSAVLDDASYRNDASADRPGAVAFSDPRLSWNGVLRAGATMQLVYSVQVTGGGDLVLDNIAFAGALSCAPATCVPPARALCGAGLCGITTTGIIPPTLVSGLALTGVSGLSDWAAAALVAIGFGIVLLALQGRRPRARRVLVVLYRR